MRYFVDDRDDKKFRYIAQSRFCSDRNFREVEPHIFREILRSKGIEYELTEDKITELQIENANLILENIDKDLKIEALENENANLLLTIAEQDLRVTQTESDIASLMLELGGIK